MMPRRRTIVGAAMGLLGLARVSDANERSAFPGRPSLGEGEYITLSAARLWLKEATDRDVARFALGEERRFVVDQASRTLTLAHADGENLGVQVEALGSFNPHNRTFRWAWSNTSVDPGFAEASEAARAHPDVEDFPSFAAPIFEASFDECRDLVALATRISGFAGVYRAINEDHVSVFLAYRQPSDAQIARIWREGRAPELDVSEALGTIVAYDAAMLPFDIEYRAQIGTAVTPAAAAEARARILDDVSRRQLEAHRRFWRRDDDYWDPSLSWPSPHDSQSRSLLLAAPRRAGGVYVVRGSGGHGLEAFVLERFGDGMRIVEIDLDWGAGLLLP